MKDLVSSVLIILPIQMAVGLSLTNYGVTGIWHLALVLLAGMAVLTGLDMRNTK